MAELTNGGRRARPIGFDATQLIGVGGPHADLPAHLRRLERPARAGGSGDVGPGRSDQLLPAIGDRHIGEPVEIRNGSGEGLALNGSAGDRRHAYVVHVGDCRGRTAGDRLVVAQGIRIGGGRSNLPSNLCLLQAECVRSGAGNIAPSAAAIAALLPLVANDGAWREPVDIGNARRKGLILSCGPAQGNDADVVAGRIARDDQRRGRACSVGFGSCRLIGVGYPERGPACRPAPPEASTLNRWRQRCCSRCLRSAAANDM